MTRHGAQPILGEVCAWCGLPAVASIEIEGAQQKTVSNPQTGISDQVLTRAPIRSFVCDAHREITARQAPPPEAATAVEGDRRRADHHLRRARNGPAQRDLQGRVS